MSPSTIDLALNLATLIIGALVYKKVRACGDSKCKETIKHIAQNATKQPVIAP